MVAPSIWFTSLLASFNLNPRHSLLSLATIDPTVFPPIPRVRTVGFRKFIVPTDTNDWHSHQPLLLLSSDVRTHKIQDLTTHAYLDNFEVEAAQYSPANAFLCPNPNLTIFPETHPNVELLWYFPDTLEQYRLSGIIHVLPDPSHPQFQNVLRRFPVDRLSSTHRTLRDWENERIEQFNNLNPTIRAGMARPLVPHAKLENYEDVSMYPTSLPSLRELEMEQPSEDLYHLRNIVITALHNFSLLVFEAIEVEKLELGVIPNRRTIFTRDKGMAWTDDAGWVEDIKWEEDIVAP